MVLKRDRRGNRLSEILRKSGCTETSHLIIQRVLQLLFPKKLRYKILRFCFYRDPHKFWEEKGRYWFYYQRKGKDPLYDKQGGFLVDKLRKLNPTSVLEVGCGYGKFMRNVASAFDCFLIGTDFSSSQLQKAKIYLNSTGNLVQSDATRLPFKDNSFDVVYTWGVMTHIPPRSNSRSKKRAYSGGKAIYSTL